MYKHNFTRSTDLKNSPSITFEKKRLWLMILAAIIAIVSTINLIKTAHAEPSELDGMLSPDRVEHIIMTGNAPTLWDVE